MKPAKPSMKSISAKPLVSIVILNWNGLADTKLCLQHTREQTYPNFEIIIVDNGSNDGSVAWLEAQPDITLIKEVANLGFTGGHIVGYQTSNGKYVVLLNNDAVMDNDYLTKAVATLEADKSIGVLGGRAYLWDDDNPLLATTNRYYAYQNINPITAEAIFTQKDMGKIQEANNVSGSCALVRRSVIDETGYLHDPFFAYYEEADLFARIKRAGFKVVYQPDLAIWHANGKTAERKGSTFSYYMMMRNRFRFAVRNFDTWSLLRFIKFYLKMGIVSILKSPGNKQIHDRPYAKAFIYNIFMGWKAFVERSGLSHKHGTAVNYSKQIVLEQLGVSIVTYAADKQTVNKALALSRQLAPNDELVLLVKDEPLLTTYAKQFCDINSQPLRLCVDKGLLDANSLTIGVVCAKNDWLFLAQQLPAADDYSLLRATLYEARKQKKKLTYLGDSFTSIHEALTGACSTGIIIDRSLLIDAGKSYNDDTPETATSVTAMIRRYLSYGLVCAQLHVESASFKTPLSPVVLSGAQEAELLIELQSAHHESQAIHKPANLLDKLAGKYYRFQQFKNLVTWLFSSRITIRLKLARMKNLMVAAITLNQKKLAIELKHIRNETLDNKHLATALAARKRYEAKRLKYLKEHPEETVVFIITRDRMQPLRKLVAWLEACGLQRIVLIDNDSALPPLVDYLQQTNHQVLEMSRNVGHTTPWTAGVVRLLQPNDFYIVTDPDVIPTLDSIDVLNRLYTLHEAYPHHLKVGLGLKIDDLPDAYTLKDKVIEWESQFWKHPLAKNVYEAGVDTTFALYKPYTYQYIIHPSLRTGEPYTARHLPWYNDSTKPTKEDTFYRLRADQNVNTWDMDVLPERYVKELAKQRS